MAKTAKLESPPAAPKRPMELEHNGDVRIDDYYWLRERDNPDVLKYLQAENDYLEQALASTNQLQEDIFQEIKSRIQETDASAPIAYQDFEYFARTIEGLQYHLHCRRERGTVGLPNPLAAPGTEIGETVLLDENELAQSHEYFDLETMAMSPNQNVIAYMIDITGSERYELRFRKAGTGEDFPDIVPNVAGGVGWANDNKTIFYTRLDDIMRPSQLWKHVLGQPVTDDVLIFEEDDGRFNIGVGRTRSNKFVVFSSESKTTSEVWLIPADDPTSQPMCVQPRISGLEYSIEHHFGKATGDRLFILTNLNEATNFKLMVTPLPEPGKEHWQEVMPHREDTRLEDVEAFANFLIISERTNGLEQLSVMQVTSQEITPIDFPDAVYSTWFGANPEYDTETLRYKYTSLARPMSDFAYNVTTRQSILVKEQPVHNFDSSNYVTSREWATASDGAKVPISIVQRRDTPINGTAPGLLYGYGSYELSIDPAFSASRLSLLDRGFVFAIAHIRGGGELGRSWYENGKFEHKVNTFTDFIACAEHLIQNDYCAPNRLAARGGSAGGLLMGAIANMRPDLFRAIIAEVPFVDALTTMLDLSLPLTVNEFEEWGNPDEDLGIYELMKSYSPYDNVRKVEYPAMYVSGGLNDPRVSYWEPAKWVAKLRTMNTSDRLIVLRTEMGAGHGGRSGRYEMWRDEAQVLAFICDQLGVQ